MNKICELFWSDRPLYIGFWTVLRKRIFGCESPPLMVGQASFSVPTTCSPLLCGLADTTQIHNICRYSPQIHVIDAIEMFLIFTPCFYKPQLLLHFISSFSSEIKKYTFHSGIIRNFESFRTHKQVVLSTPTVTPGCTPGRLPVITLVGNIKVR